MVVFVNPEHVCISVPIAAPSNCVSCKHTIEKNTLKTTTKITMTIPDQKTNLTSLLVKGSLFSSSCSSFPAAAAAAAPPLPPSCSSLFFHYLQCNKEPLSQCGFQRGP